ncbi:MAG: lamin tail domain-containing protein [Chitinophagales bacterium]
MKRHPFRLFSLACIFLCVPAITHAQVVLNEIASRGDLLDNTGSGSDWIELYNAGAVAVDLSTYTLSDDAMHPGKWHLPGITLAPGAYFLVYANGEDTHAVSDHWESAVYSTDIWKYFVGTSEPPADWKSIGFDDAAWLSGMGGMGYGDGDDGTIIPSTRSVFMRQPFYVADTSIFSEAQLHADYDDAFVAYLNGVEIARSANIIGTPPDHNTLATTDHEAGLYMGIPPELYSISYAQVHDLLVPGTNYLCVQVHNVTVGSSDLSSNFWLSFGITTPDVVYGPTPAWFVEPVSYVASNFSITNTGETIYLCDLLGNILDMQYTGDLALHNSIARIPDGSANWCITNTATPSTSNNAAVCFAGYEPVPVFSQEPGWYSGAQTISLSSTSPTAQIRYTTNGSAVTAASPVYTSPFLIDTSVVLSAKCFSTGALLPGEQKQNVYFIDEATHDIPVLNISIDPSSLFDYDTGIYVFGCCYDDYYPYFGANFWQPWERAANISYFTPDGVQQWESDMALEIHGGWSRAEDQRSFRVDFKGIYDGNVQYPLWRDKPEMQDINNFNIRNGGQHIWTYKFHDALLASVMRNTHIDYEAYEPVALYINGRYWGWYGLREKADEHYAQSNYGYDNNEVDFLNAWGALNGSDSGYINMYGYVTTHDPLSVDYYDRFAQWMDVENYVDYYIGEIYYQNVDFGGAYWGVNNIKLWRPQGGGKFRFIMYDMDGSMGYFGSVPSDNYINIIRNPASPNAYSIVFDHVLDNPQFQKYFVNRFADLINTIYLPENFNPVADSMYAEIFTEIPDQLARWGAPNVGTVIYNVNNTKNYNATRYPYARAHINTSFGLNGQKEITLDVTPLASGHIHINTITPGPLPWDGIYFSGNPVTLTALAEPGYTFDHWEPNALLPAGSTDPVIEIDLTMDMEFVAVFNGAPADAHLIVSELNYHSADIPDAGDWVELYNNSGAALDVSGWQLEDRSGSYTYTLPVSVVMDPHGYIILAQDTNAFRTQYPTVEQVYGGFSFFFDNHGDEIKIFDLNRNAIIDFSYADSLDWPRGADGAGRTLELTNVTADPDNASSWFDGCIGGSPGAPYTPCQQEIVFGEVNYHSNDLMDAGDWVELWNTSADPVDLSGWKFVDEHDTLLFVIPAGTIVEADARIVLVQNVSKFSARHPDVEDYIAPFAFGLDGNGEQLRLLDAADQLHFSVWYDDVAPWPAEPDGGGATLELLDANGMMNSASNWFAGCPEGSPAMPYDPDCPVPIENVLPGSFAVYPNPATEGVFIQCMSEDPGIASMDICDATGKLVRRMELIPGTTYYIDKNALPAGMYYFRFRIQESVLVKKIVWM